MNFSAKWHATRCPLPISRSGGSSRLQMSAAYGQRGLNRQPAGGFTGLGTSPGRMMRVLWRCGSGIGTADRRAPAYVWAGSP